MRIGAVSVMAESIGYTRSFAHIPRCGFGFVRRYRHISAACGQRSCVILEIGCAVTQANCIAVGITGCAVILHDPHILHIRNFDALSPDGLTEIIHFGLFP